MQPNPIHKHQAFGNFMARSAQGAQGDLADKPIAVLADVFADATWRQPGVNEHQVKRVLKFVHDRQEHAAFDAAVAQLARQDGRTFANAQTVLERKWLGNPVGNLFNQAPVKDAADVYLTGTNQHRAKPWEYRTRGMWLSVANFLDVCRQYPVMSAAVVAATAYLGGKYPFLGGASGLAIIGAAGTGIAQSEHQAKRAGNNAEKAHAYKQSGENLAALLLTLSGIDGILAGTWQGVKAIQTGAVTASHPQVIQLAQRLWNGVKMTMPGGHHMGIRFVVGLLDNVLMPFNSVAKNLKNRDSKQG